MTENYYQVCITYPFNFTIGYYSNQNDAVKVSEFVRDVFMDQIEGGVDVKWITWDAPSNLLNQHFVEEKAEIKVKELINNEKLQNVIDIPYDVEFISYYQECLRILNLKPHFCNTLLNQNK